MRALGRSPPLSAANDEEDKDIISNWIGFYGFVEFTGLDPQLEKTMQPLPLDYNVHTAKWQQRLDMMIESKVLEKPHRPPSISRTG